MAPASAPRQAQRPAPPAPPNTLITLAPAPLRARAHGDAKREARDAAPPCLLLSCSPPDLVPLLLRPYLSAPTSPPLPLRPQVHGDVKPENIMLSGSGTVKIGDFGQSQFFGRRDVFNRTLGTPAYLGA